MLSFKESLLLAVVSSGLSSIIIGSIFTYIFNKKLSQHEKILEVRKKLYTDIAETLAEFFNTANVSTRREACQNLLVLLRKSQIWASKEVLTQFNKLLFAIDISNNQPQSDKDSEYKKLIISMRKCITKKSIDEKSIYPLGEIN